MVVLAFLEQGHQMLHAKPISVTISVVSHGHDALVQCLVRRLAVLTTKTALDIKLIITNNLPCSESLVDQLKLDHYRFTIAFLDNENPLGFGANHNQAFRHCESDFFCILNPDIELINDPFVGLINAFTDPKIGLTYPSQTDEKNVLLDFERELVEPVSVAQRHLTRRRYHSDDKKPVHWVSGAFMMFSSSIFRELGGFDERYFMYCEDVDICLRMQLVGYRLVRADATVIHNTQRQTLKNPRHLAWHIRSLLRLWSSAPYKEYKRKFINSHK
jgi:N-acetylglucosaminyl-diphospho-decaprenol L-rhamnosyltransferase